MTNYQENTQGNTQENSQENSQESFSLTTSQNSFVLPPSGPTYQDILNDDLYIPYHQNSSFNSNIGTASSTGVNGLSSFEYSLEDTIRRVVTEVISKDLKNIIQDTIKEALTNVGNSNLVSLSRKFYFLL